MTFILHQVTGRGLAYQLRGRTAAQRAVLAVNDAVNGFVLTNPTDRQLAALYRICVPAVIAARSLTRRNGPTLSGDRGRWSTRSPGSSASSERTARKPRE